MPIFEYECRACHRVYESLIMNQLDHKDLICPHCGGQKGKRLVSAVSVVRSPSKKHKDRMHALSQVDPAKPQEVARHFKDHGSRFGESGFRGTRAWEKAIDRVSAGGPTLEE